MSELIDQIGLYWQALGGNNIDQISGHCYRYTDCCSDSCAVIPTTIIIDIGKFDNYQALGVDGATAAIPDIRKFLEPGPTSAQALLITHSHPDHLNGLIHYLKLGYKLPPVHLGRYTALILEDLLRDFHIPQDHYPELKIIAAGDVLQIGSLEIEVVASSHTCFDSFGFLIKSASALVYHTGDMKIDNSTYFRKPTDLKRLRQLAGKVDVVVADFYGIVEDGTAVKEVDTFKKLVTLIRRHHKRKVFIPVYPTHPEMYIIAFLAALKLRKNVVFYGNADFYSYLGRIMDYGISFTQMAQNRIKVLFHPDHGLDALEDNYVVIGTYNFLKSCFAPTRFDTLGIITASTFFNPLKGQFNLRSIKFISVDEEPVLQGFGHGFLGDYEQINQLLDRPLFLATHCPHFVIENFAELAAHLNFNLVTPIPANNQLFRINGRQCVKISEDVAKWLAINYDNPRQPLTEVVQKPTSGQGFLKRTISNRRCQSRFKMILHQRQLQECK